MCFVVRFIRIFQKNLPNLFKQIKTKQIMNPFLSDLTSLTEIPPVLLAIVVTWSLFWKGLALWKAARRGSQGWFVALLIINTLGIFEILYIFLFSEIKLTDVKDKKESKKKPTKSKSSRVKTKLPRKGFLE